MTRLLVCAAEASGDRLAADLVGVLGDVDVAAVAGPALRARGVDVVARAEDATAFGLAEVIGSLPRIRRVLGRVEAVLDTRPNLVVGVDAPGLNAQIGAMARARGIPFVQWVAPQVWAWRRGRAARIGAWADEVLCLLPWEPLWLRPHGVRARFVGHPRAVVRRDPYPAGGSILLAPGSRPDEIRRLWPVLCATAAAIRARDPAARFVIPRASTVDRDSLRDAPGPVVDGLDAAMDLADLAVCASGTATLELAARGIPQVVLYRLHPLTHAAARVLVRDLPGFSLPNLLAPGSVPEHLQRLDPNRIADDVLALRGDAGRLQRDRLAGPLAALDAHRAIDKVAAAIRERL